MVTASKIHRPLHHSWCHSPLHHSWCHRPLHHSWCHSPLHHSWCHSAFSQRVGLVLACVEEGSEGLDLVSPAGNSLVVRLASRSDPSRADPSDISDTRIMILCCGTSLQSISHTIQYPSSSLFFINKSFVIFDVLFVRRN